MYKSSKISGSFFRAFISYIQKTLIIRVFINILMLVCRKSSKLFQRRHITTKKFENHSSIATVKALKQVKCLSNKTKIMCKCDKRASLQLKCEQLGEMDFQAEANSHTNEKLTCFQQIKFV